MSPQPWITVAHAAFGYGGRAVVRVDDLALAAGDCLGIFGHNGSGKTTLVRGLLGLLPPVAGRIAVHARKPRVGFVSQYRGIDTAWPMTGFDAASLAVSARTSFGRLPRSARLAMTSAMDRLGVTDLADRSFAALSGGQQQRLLLAGALAATPDVLVLDEPTDGLDRAARAGLFDTLRALKADGLCVVIISHDVQDLLAACDRIVWLKPGAAGDTASTAECVTPAELGHALVHGGAA